MPIQKTIIIKVLQELLRVVQVGRINVGKSNEHGREIFG